MKVSAVSKDVRVSSRKVKLIVDMVRGRKVDEALTLLRFLTQTPAVQAVSKTIKSAAANAENNFQMEPADLKIAEIFANEGHTFKRFRAQGRGRVSPILKRSTHINVSVAEEEEQIGT